jgi:hypothetical protein
MKTLALRAHVFIHCFLALSLFIYYVLPYADDLVLKSRTCSGLQFLLDNVSLAADTLNLNFRPDNCATLSLTCSKREPDCVGDTIFNVQHGAIPALKKEESYRYLGVPIGLLYDANYMNNIMSSLFLILRKQETHY